MMRIAQYILIFLIGGLLLQGGWLSAQEYLALWRNPDTVNFYVVQQKFNEYFANRARGQGSGYNQFKRWEEFMEPRVYPSGKLINPAKIALDEELRYRSTVLMNTHGGQWQSLGIKGFKTTTTGWSGGIGRVNCIVPHPVNSNILYIGTPAGGIWKAELGSGGIPVRWESLSDGLPIIGVSGIAIDHTNPAIIYILTGDGDADQTSSIGVLKSVNGGNTWQSTGLQWNTPSGIRGYKLLMHPVDNNILFAVTNKGIYKTADGGINWSIKQSGSFTDLVFKPWYPYILYAVTPAAFYTSSDVGDHWAVSGTGLPISPGSDRIAIGVTPASAEHVYLLYGSPKGFLGLYRSQDGGKNFALRSNSPNILGYEIKAPFDTESQSSYDLAIAVSPTNKEELHIGGINCWRSMDEGETWRYTSYWAQDEPDAGHGRYTHCDIHALVFNNNTLYCGSDGGIYQSVDHAATCTWKDITTGSMGPVNSPTPGVVNTQFYRIGTPATNLKLVYGGAQDNGINKWIAPVARKDTAMDQVLGADGMECVIDYTNEKIVYAFIQEGKSLYVTTDGGVNWTEYKKTLNGDWVVPLIMDPQNHTTLYAGYKDVYRITSLGAAFTPLNTNNTDSPYVALGMSAANASYLYAATPTSIKLSTNANASNPGWTNITARLPVNAAQISGVAVSALNERVAFVTFSGYSKGNKVYETSDGGKTWMNISGTLPNVPVNCIIYHNNGKDALYIGTDIGVFFRDNTMNDWIPFRNGMPNVIVRDLEITRNKIRVATFGRGIWQSGLYGDCSPGHTLSGDVTGYQFYEASDFITSAVNIKGGIGTAVQYKAVNLITMEPGFEVAPGSDFLASNGKCDGTHAYENRYRGAYEGVMTGALGIASPSDSIPGPANRLKVYVDSFSGRNTIEFYIATKSEVTISIYDLSGRLVKVVFTSQIGSPGNYQAGFESAGLSREGYLVRLEAGDYQETKKIIITQ